jgi:hypothetical protein
MSTNSSAELAYDPRFTQLYRMSVWVRWTIGAGLIVLAFTVGPWQLVLFASVDLLGGAWTDVAPEK